MNSENPFAIPSKFFDTPSPFMKELGEECLKAGCIEISADKMYRDIFPAEYLQSVEDKGSGHDGNPLVLIERAIKKDGKPALSHPKRILFNDYEFIHKWRDIPEVKHVWLSGLGYIGKKRDLNHATTMFAMIFDIDYMSVEGIQTLFYQAEHDVIPLPNYISLSGSGIHAYYVFEEPLPLYHGSYGRKIKGQLNELKHELTTTLWNPYIVGREHYEDIQYQGINQAFRLVGSYTKSQNKLHERYTVIAYQTSAKPYYLERLYDYTANKIPEERRYKSSSIHGIDFWKEKNPDWYQRRIIEKDKSVKYWTNHRRLYDWFLGQIREHGRFGHRYNCLFCLCVYAVKCDIDTEELEQDMISLLPFFKELRPQDPITMEDVQEALSAYDLSLKTYPVKSIQYLSGIDMNIGKTRRNGRKQALHLKLARTTEDVLYPDGEWREGNGRPPKQDIVKEWRQAHPDGKKIECERDTGLSRHTVLKWWEVS